MDELVFMKGNDIFTDSLVIADGTGNEHESVVRTLLNYQDKLLTLGALNFTDLKSGKRGRPTRIYLLNEIQSTFLITLLKNTDTVVNFKLELVKQFFQMRQLLLDKSTKQWMETRYQGKLTRKAETEIIHHLIEYAKAQGSTHAGRLYIVYSKLANQTAGIKTRETASIFQLNNLSLIEGIILHVIKAGIDVNKGYKEIYKDCKQQLESFKEIACLAG